MPPSRGGAFNRCMHRRPVNDDPVSSIRSTQPRNKDVSHVPSACKAPTTTRSTAEPPICAVISALRSKQVPCRQRIRHAPVTGCVQSNVCSVGVSPPSPMRANSTVAHRPQQLCERPTALAQTSSWNGSSRCMPAWTPLRLEWQIQHFLCDVDLGQPGRHPSLLQAVGSSSSPRSGCGTNAAKYG